MCWFTLTPSKAKKHHHHSSNSSCAEDLVRVHTSPHRHRFSDVKIKVPGSLSMDMSNHHHHHHPHHLLNHHHRHPHFHPLHMHPIHGSHHHHHDRNMISLHGHSKRRASPPPGPPPPTRDPSRSRPREPIYHTQIVEPAQVRESTRVALRSVQQDRDRGRLRRVAGYEVLGAQVPFDWDCISSTAGAGSTSAGGKWIKKKVKSGGGGLRYPPFGSMDRWL